jgi:hypothetical protein
MLTGYLNAWFSTSAPEWLIKIMWITLPTEPYMDSVSIGLGYFIGFMCIAIGYFYSYPSKESKHTKIDAIFYFHCMVFGILLVLSIYAIYLIVWYLIAFVIVRIVMALVRQTRLMLQALKN